MLAFILSFAIFINFMFAILGTNTVSAGVVEDAVNGAGTVVGGIFTVIGGLATGLVAIIISVVLRVPILLVGGLLKLLMNSIVSLCTFQITDVTIEHVLFSGYIGKNGFGGIDFIDINFFNFTSGTGALNTFRTAIAQWYYIMRLISAAILLVILIYVGIRMAISTIASDQAKYKQMLVDWATSLALLFVLHYIIIFIIEINNSLVSALGGLMTVENGKTIGQKINELIYADMLTTLISGIISAILYVIIQFMSFRFLIFYLRRMITVAFLIIISPLITITYSIDKMGDGKAQALNAWLKEISYNILIQPFHCVIYLSFFGAIAEIIDGNGLMGAILAWAVLTFMDKAEGILRKIFHFEANSMPSVTEPAQGFMNATGKFAKMGVNAGKALSNFRQAGGFNALKNGFAEGKAKREIKKDVEAGNIDTHGKSFSDYMKTEEYNNELDKRIKTNAAKEAEKKQAKRTNKAQKIYDSQSGRRNGDFDKQVDEKTKKEYEKKNPGKSYDALSSEEKEKYRNQARESLTRETLANGDKKRRTITGVKNAGSKVFEAGKQFYNMRAVQAGLGLGKDTLKVASAIAFGAAGYGMTGQMNDAISMGQLGYGLSTGILENTTKTILKDQGSLYTQYAITNGLGAEEMKAFATELANLCERGSISGEFKDLANQFNKKVQELEAILGKNAAELISAIRVKTATGEQHDIYELLGEYLDRNHDELGDVSDADWEKSVKILKDASNLAVMSAIAGNQSKLESTVGMDTDSSGRMTVKHIENNTIDQTLDNRKTYNYYQNINPGNGNGPTP